MRDWRRAGWPLRACRPRCGCGAGQIHDFQLAVPVDARRPKRSLRQIGEYIREATG